MPTPQVAIKTKLQSDECKEVQEAKDSQSHNSDFDESSVPTPDHENVTVTITDSPPAKEVEDGSLDVSELSSSVGSCEHDVQKELAPTRESHNEGEVIVSSSSSLIQGFPLRCFPYLSICICYDYCISQSSFNFLVF